jgi:hypothetical protein
MTTTVFQEYIDSIEDTDIDEIHSLYTAVECCMDMGTYRCSLNNGKYFVQSNYGDTILMLTSEESRKAFLKVLDYNFGGGFGWVGGHYEFVRSMRKDD